MDFSTFKGSAYKLPGDFVKVQILIQILGDSDAAGPGTTLEIVTSKAALSNIVAVSHMALVHLKCD